MNVSSSNSGSFFQTIASTLTAGALAGVIAVTSTISYGVTIFSGDLSTHLSAGISMMLFGGLIVGAMIALTSSTKGVIALPKAAITPVMALLAAQIAAEMPASATDEQIFLTIAVAFGVSTIAIGLTYLLFGLFGLGNLIRYMPFPVFAGFLAGLGWLLLKGGLRVISDLPVQLESLHVWAQADMLIRWVPGVAFALLLLLFQRISKNLGAISIVFVLSLGVFHLIAWNRGLSLSELTEQGWLLGPFPPGGDQLSLSNPAWLSDLQAIPQKAIQIANWPVIARQSLTIITLIPISLLNLLFNSSGIELATKQDAKINRELGIAGIANIFAGLSGGMMGCQTASLSTLAYNMGARNRFTGLVTAGFFGVVFFYGNTIISILPKILIGGLLLYLGLTFLLRWVFQSYAILSRNEYFIVLLILVVIATIGLLQGVLVGVLATVVLFAINYSQIHVVRSALTRATYQSNVERSHYFQEYLRANGEKIYILKLQGFIFFGTAFDLLQEVRQRTRNDDLPNLNYLVLDFHLVHGIDSSALNSFTRLHHVAESHNFTIALANVSNRIRKQLVQGDILSEEDQHVREFDDIDHAIEWCEDQLLANLTIVRAPSVRERLKEAFSDSARLDQFFSYLEEMIIDANTVVIEEGASPQGMFFIQSGKVTVQITLENEIISRLRTMSAGTIVGELGAYLKKPASATVITDVPSVAYFLSVENLETMEREDPELASAFHKYIAKFIGRRLVDMNTTLEAFMT